jgi:hypothetical protein
MKTTRAAVGPWMVALMLGATACGGGPEPVDVIIFDGGFGSDGGPRDGGDDDGGVGRDAEARPDAQPEDTGVDAGVEDTGVEEDAGFIDGGFIDGGVDEDGGFIDGGVVDGGTPDSGVVDTGVDAGFPDTGVDAGFPDTGVDAGFPDTGVVDTGVDAGFPDTGVVDTGVDAGFPDTGLDAGLMDTGVGLDGGVDGGAYNPTPSTFTPGLIDNTFQHGQHVSVVDLDADGDLDVVSSISLTDTVRLYLNGGSSAGGGVGTVWQPIQVAPNNSVVAMATGVADFDGDGDLDIAAIDLFDRNLGFASTGGLTLYLRGAAITDWSAVPINVGANYWAPRSMATGDLTGDGLADVVTGAVEWYDLGGNVVGNGLRWHRNTSGNFALPVTLDALLLDVEGLAIADLDQDGVLDIVAVGRNNGQVVWYENNRTPGQVNNNPTFTRHVLASVLQPGHVAVGQLDADPAPEVVVIHDDGSGGAVAWYDAPLNPRGPWTRHLISGAFGGTNGVFRVAVADLNNDGFSDVVASSMPGGQVRAFIRSAAGWSNVLVRNLTGVDNVGVGDLSGDGRVDIIGTSYENTPTADRLEWYRNVP